MEKACRCNRLHSTVRATNKAFKKAKNVKVSKTTATISGLEKGKTYYARINAYAKISGKKYSNKWYTVKFKM